MAFESVQKKQPEIGLEGKRRGEAIEGSARNIADLASTLDNVETVLKQQQAEFERLTKGMNERDKEIVRKEFNQSVWELMPFNTKIAFAAEAKFKRLGGLAGEMAKQFQSMKVTTENFKQIGQEKKKQAQGLLGSVESSQAELANEIDEAFIEEFHKIEDGSPEATHARENLTAQLNNARATYGKQGFYDTFINRLRKENNPVAATLSEINAGGGAKTKVA